MASIGQIWFNNNYTVKNGFGLSVFYFQLLECILQVLQTSTDPVNNLQHLLRLPNFDKTRLVAFHLQYNKGNYIDLLFQKEKTLSVYDLDLLLVITNDNHC